MVVDAAALPRAFAGARVFIAGEFAEPFEAASEKEPSAIYLFRYINRLHEPSTNYLFRCINRLKARRLSPWSQIHVELYLQHTLKA